MPRCLSLQFWELVGGQEFVLSVLAASDPLLDFGEKGGRKVI